MSEEIAITPLYPNAVYFHHHLSRDDYKPITELTNPANWDGEAHVHIFGRELIMREVLGGQPSSLMGNYVIIDFVRPKR